MSTLSQKVVLVTGASGGIGAEISRQFAKAGAKVMVDNGGRKEPADQIVSDIQKAGGDAFAIQADMRKSTEIKDLFDRSIAQYGKIDIVVNNAGIMITKLLKDFTDEEFTRQVDVNITGAFFVLREAMARVADNGVIINMSTSVNRVSIPASGPSCAPQSPTPPPTNIPPHHDSPAP